MMSEWDKRWKVWVEWVKGSKGMTTLYMGKRRPGRREDTDQSGKKGLSGSKAVSMQT